MTLLLCCVVFLFTLTRVLFYAFNLNLFSISFFDFLKILVYGLRFDLSAIFYLNAIFVIVWLIPFKFRENLRFRKSMMWAFVAINSVALLANCADIIYYRFTLKRTTADFFSFLGVGGEFEKLLPLFLKDFWYIAIIWGVLVFALIKGYQIIQIKTLRKHDEYSQTSFFIQSLTLVFALFITVLAMRGGFQLRPINIITAGKYSQGNASAVVLNTPFTILQTIGKQDLKPVEFFSQKEVETIYSPVHQSLINNKIPANLSAKKNIVMIVVESLSMEHIGFFNKHISGYKGFTPFLDKVAEKSLVFYGISNGKKSIEGIPAIISGIPTLMNTPFASSPYSGNIYQSLPGILAKNGYQTAFFHGGINGTMGFDSYCKAAGFQSYFGKNEYPSIKEDDDGSWGIWDEPYLQYFSRKMDDFHEPFYSTVFTLSSHHPFKIPSRHQGKFPKGKLPIQETIAYADYSLERFFESAAKTKWFNNTLFIITADHTSEADLGEYKSDFGIFRIPMIFFDPTSDLSVYSDSMVAQQIDILPTVLSYLHYDKPLFGFGNNLLDTNSVRFAINYKQPNYQLILGNYLMVFDGENVLALYDIQKDKKLTLNLLSKKPDTYPLMERFVKAFIQQYNHSLIYNKMNFFKQ